MRSVLTVPVRTATFRALLDHCDARIGAADCVNRKVLVLVQARALHMPAVEG